MPRRSKATTAKSTPKPPEPSTISRRYFRSIYELLDEGQAEIAEAVRTTRLDVASRIGQLVSEAFQQHGWTDANLVELSTWLVQRGGDHDLCAAPNLGRMRRLYELEVRIVRGHHNDVLNPCHSSIPPEDVAAELDAIDGFHAFDPEHDPYLDALFEGASEGPPARGKRN